MNWPEALCLLAFFVLCGWLAWLNHQDECYEDNEETE